MPLRSRTAGATASAALTLFFALTSIFASPARAQSLVINEIDYDQPGNDTLEFVEIKNISASPVSLANIALVLINGANNLEYPPRTSLASAGTLNPGQYLVVASPAVQVAAGALVINFSMTVQNVIQNGAPDGVALIDTATQTIIDSLSYEGSINAAVITGFPGTWNLVQGTPTTAVDPGIATESLVRYPDGRHTGDDASDWRVAPGGAPTPGASNGGCGPVPGDIDGDNAVGLSDIAAVINCWGQPSACNFSADLDLSGDIGLGDIAIVIQSWGAHCP